MPAVGFVGIAAAQPVVKLPRRAAGSPPRGHYRGDGCRRAHRAGSDVRRRPRCARPAGSGPWRRPNPWPPPGCDAAARASRARYRGGRRHGRHGKRRGGCPSAVARRCGRAAVGRWVGLPSARRWARRVGARVVHQSDEGGVGPERRSRSVSGRRGSSASGVGRHGVGSGVWAANA